MWRAGRGWSLRGRGAGSTSPGRRRAGPTRPLSTPALSRHTGKPVDSAKNVTLFYPYGLAVWLDVLPQDEAGSRVFGTVEAGRFSGTIVTSGAGSYYVEPAKRYLPPGSNTRHAMLTRQNQHYNLYCYVSRCPAPATRVPCQRALRAVPRERGAVGGEGRLWGEPGRGGPTGRTHNPAPPGGCM